jgi:hypothetical protein
MNRFGSFFKPLMWLMALLLAAFVAGCGGGGDGSGTSAGSDAASPATPGPGPGAGGGGQGPAPVNLGTAGNYAILTKTGISTTGATAVTGNIAVSPAFATSLTGFALSAPPTTFSTSALVVGGGQVFAADYDNPTPAILTTAVSDMEGAYTAAAGAPAGVGPFLNLGAGNVSGRTLVAGVYTWGSNVTIPTDLTLSGGANDVWIFQITGTLSIAANMHVLLIGGAQAHNIFWQVADAVTLQTGSHFEGIILAKTNIAMVTSASTNGRLLAQTEVALDANAVTQP